MMVSRALTERQWVIVRQWLHENVGEDLPPYLTIPPDLNALLDKDTDG